MSATERAPHRRPYRRRNAMTAGLTVHMTVEMRDGVEVEAEADGVSAADVVRMALAEYLPKSKERRRKRRGRAARTAPGK